MTLIPTPPGLPAALLPAFQRMNTSADLLTDSPTTDIAAVTDWFYRERWHTGLAERAELEWLRYWMNTCGSAQLLEITDAVCVLRLEAGEIESGIALAREVLATQPDFSLSHTLALSLAAQGQGQAAISTLEEALGAQAPNALADQGVPSEHIGQAWLDLAHLFQQNKSLFKAIRPAKQAIELAQQHQNDELLRDGLRFLTEQLIEQGGADEAWDYLSMFLSDEPNPTQLMLWELAFMRLAEQLPPTAVDRGAQLFLQAGYPDPLIKYLYQQAETRRDRNITLLAFIVALIHEAPIDIAAPLAANLLLRDQDRQAESAPLIAAAAMALAEQPDERSIKRAHWHRDAMVQLISVAKHQGVPEAAVKQWAEDQRLYREQGIIERAREALLSDVHNPPIWLVNPSRSTTT
ncbi:MAG TPA: hypothetical protein VMV35_01830 [Halothiobacillus sp.]|nr:hypothetical protein [Halothiobacillus sp.]